MNNIILKVVEFSTALIALFLIIFTIVAAIAMGNRL
jgi:hypothetical protein